MSAENLEGKKQPDQEEPEDQQEDQEGQEEDNGADDQQDQEGSQAKAKGKGKTSGALNAAKQKSKELEKAEQEGKKARQQRQQDQKKQQQEEQKQQQQKQQQQKSGQPQTREENGDNGEGGDHGGPKIVPEFLRRVTKIMPTFGTARQDDKQFLESALTVSGGTFSIEMPDSEKFKDGFSPSVAAGYVHIKLTHSGSPTEVQIIGTDGSNEETLYSNELKDVSLSSEKALNLICPFLSDLSMTFLIVKIKGASGAKLSLEIAGSTGD